MENILIKMIKGYQKGISPLSPPSCRYYPTCSTYSIQAIEKHGTVKGSMMATARILRCNPLAKGGIDFVPEKFTLKKNSKSNQSDS